MLRAVGVEITYWTVLRRQEVLAEIRNFVSDYKKQQSSECVEWIHVTQPYVCAELRDAKPSVKMTLVSMLYLLLTQILVQEWREFMIHRSLVCSLHPFLARKKDNSFVTLSGYFFSILLSLYGIINKKALLLDILKIESIKAAGQCVYSRKPRVDCQSILNGYRR